MLNEFELSIIDNLRHVGKAYDAAIENNSESNINDVAIQSGLLALKFRELEKNKLAISHELYITLAQNTSERLRTIFLLGGLSILAKMLEERP